MSLANYTKAFRNIADEIEGSLSQEDISRAAAGLKSAGKPAWIRWLLDNEKAILEFLRLTPSKRASKKDWKDANMRILLPIAALLRARQAQRLASAAEQCLDTVGLGYRDAVSATAASFLALEFEVDMLWPFRGRDPWGDLHPLDALDPENLAETD